MTSKRDRVAALLGEEISAGRWAPGDRLPTERELSTKYGCSREVVRGALGDLAEAGHLESIQGGGWYARDIQPLRYPLMSIDAGRLQATEDVWHTWVRTEGRQPGAELTVRLESPPPRVAALLELEPGELAVARRRVRLVDREPWMVSTGWWPLWIAAGTPIAEERDMQHPSVLAYAAQIGHPQVRSENEIGARMPTLGEITELGTGRGIPVMTMLTTGWEPGGRPLRCTADVFPAHRFRLVVCHERQEP